ncbi:DUF1428 domain-containing protein [Pseudooceanicola lipolyticus]|uniref:DUF1428 domain-containing protein n=1 Tax=Pseudooceanicola lipolyticus TaxID=2029104 RepID=A0A2M8IZ42_9RHOB|nr:DUF1428 domain-containing protein [Pseudooceanicola lipolyticus]PJE35764.1 DUF1428 domain-containing protein [Pseudooceanicola lipolyticus]
MSYIDGFVAAVPTAKKQDYIAFCKLMGQVMKDCGAQQVVDCWGDDVPEGKVTSFPMAVKAEKDETVCFGWVIWPDKPTRDAGMEQMMKDPRCAPDQNPMPFDGMRMIFGGFEPLSGL